MNEATFHRNLSHACSHFSSIAEVCRRVGLNRQQFNKYLSGQTRPSRHNMRRITDFFGVTEAELLGDESHFAELMSFRRSDVDDGSASPVVQRLKALNKASGPLDRYQGWYFRYFHAFGFPGKIIRSLGVIAERDGYYIWKNLEHAGDSSPSRSRIVSKYDGLVFMLGNRIHIVEYESMMFSSITQMILYPSYHSGIDYLSGIQTGGALKRGRKPAASSVLLQYLGKQIDRRRALRQCAMFRPDEIDATIRDLIHNPADAESWVFEIGQN